MKRIGTVFLCALLLLVTGCARQEGEQEVKSEPSARVAWAAYQFDQAYEPAEGWIYEMVIPSGRQLDELKELMSAVSVREAGEELMVEVGYRIVLLDEEGAVQREMIVLANGSVSENGMICRAENVEALLAWLDVLKIDEQDIDT